MSVFKLSPYRFSEREILLADIFYLNIRWDETTNKNYGPTCRWPLYVLVVSETLNTDPSSFAASLRLIGQIKLLLKYVQLLGPSLSIVVHETFFLRCFFSGTRTIHSRNRTEFLKFQFNISIQTVWANREGLHCFPFCPHILDPLLYCKITLLQEFAKCFLPQGILPLPPKECWAEMVAGLNDSPRWNPTVIESRVSGVYFVIVKNDYVLKQVGDERSIHIANFVFMVLL